MNKLTISEAKRVLVGKQQEDMYTVRLAHLNSVITETESEIARVEEQITESATAIVEDALVNGVVDKAPSQNAVYDALVTNLNNSKSYSDSVVLGLLDDRGSFTPSGSYPTIGGSGVASAIMKGDVWYVTGLGSGVTATIGSVDVKDGDTVRALLNTPGQTAANWDVMSSPVNAITVQTLVNSRTAQTSPADSDNIPITDGVNGNAFKRLTWGTVKSLLTTLFDTLYTAKNSSITGATKTKVTYDSKGLVTSGSDATTADIADSTNKRYVTDSQLTVIGNTSNTNSGNETTTTIGTLVNIASSKTTPVDADQLPLMDSEASNVIKKLSWATLKSLLTTLFNTLYAPLDPRIQTVTSAATVTPTFSNELVIISAQAAALTLANPTGTTKDGKDLLIRIKDNGTARAITFDTQYRAIGVTLPTTTVAGKWMYLGAIYNSADGKWDILGLNQQV
jgi:hypothetical protein